MKKLFLTAALAILFKGLSALPLYICTSQGFLFQVTWYYQANGELGFYLESQGPGSCTGGPWQIQYISVNPNVPLDNQPPLASAQLHETFSTFFIPTPPEYGASEVKEAVSMIKVNTANAYSFNPNAIHPVWAKSFALANSQSIYFMKLNANPTAGHHLNFQIWSTKSQVALIKLIDPATAAVVWSAKMELSEAKNMKSIPISTSISGAYVLQISSSENALTANVIIN